jgi:hypothetical protein
MLKQRRTFVLRVWYEHSVGDAEAPALRGALERVDTNVVRYFGSLADLVSLVEEALGDRHNTAEEV